MKNLTLIIEVEDEEIEEAFGESLEELGENIYASDPETYTVWLREKKEDEP